MASPNQGASPTPPRKPATPDPKRNLSNSIILAVMGTIVALILIQNFLEMKMARVSFSYQLEPLVNLDLIQSDESRKIAGPNNLVTFSGKFRDRLTDEGKNRYKYLEALDESHELQLEKQRIAGELPALKQKVGEATELFLQVSGIPVPTSGYRVVDQIYDTPDHTNHVIITSVPQAAFASLTAVEQQLRDLPREATAAEIDVPYRETEVLLQEMRSPALGIGNELMKQKLRSLDATLSRTTEPDKLAQTTIAVNALRDMVADLSQEQDHVRLRQLRSVRTYKDALDNNSALAAKIDEASGKLEKARQAVANVIWFYNNQELSIRVLEKQDAEAYHQWFLNEREEWRNFSHNAGAYFKAPDQPSNKVLEKTFKSEELQGNYMQLLVSIAPVFLILLLLYFAFSRQMRGMGSSALDFGKSPAKLYPKGSTKVTFKDVAGIDECLEELQEVVEFLKNPQKFTALGGRIPKGVLCIGPPGTGKTLVAKAVAGEADCPFFSISGSDFVEMFVGVGASRIRKMFEEAKRNAPCIIFMDEIDAVGRHRGAGGGGGHDEREQTLNQLLVEMDGFDTTEGIILIAATNRPDVLDRALLRPGRFDRQVYISLPDIKGRCDILKVHARSIKLDAGVDLTTVARGTPGCSGADLKNLLNEAALLAARKCHAAVMESDVLEARDKVLYGKERRSLELDEQEKKTTAFHESGHAVVSAFVKHADPIDKVTIIPRGPSLGSTMFLPKKNRVSYWRSELLDQLAVLMGGRAAEEVFVGDVSSGAKQDIERATHIVRSMVCEWGMSEALGAVTYDERSDSGQYLGFTNFREKQYSEQTSQSIDQEVRRFLDEAYQRALTIIRENRDIIESMTEVLIEFETIDSEDFHKIIARQWNPDDKKAKLAQIAAASKQPQVAPTPAPVTPPVPPAGPTPETAPEPPQASSIEAA